MYLKSIELLGFKSFAKKSPFDFSARITGIVGPNGSGKSNVAEAFRFVLGEQSIKSLRGKKGEDLIWNGSPTVPRQNRASVKVIFDNKEKRLNVDFDEVSFERVVHRDGINQYLINDSQVRLRDVVELLAGANIGSSGHHIISQGEADRILTSNPAERRVMIEDALGLRIFQYKRQESEKKLAKTKENLTQVQALRGEVAPHLRFLEKQMQKIERALSLKETLTKDYLEYLLRESIYLEGGEKDLTEKEMPLRKEQELLEEKLIAARETLEKSAKRDEKSGKLLELEAALRGAREDKEKLFRDMGKLEGGIAARERLAQGVDAQIPIAKVRSAAQEIERSLNEAVSAGDISAVRRIITSVQGFVQEFLRSLSEGVRGEDRELDTLLEKKRMLEEEIGKAQIRGKAREEKYHALQKDIEEKREKGREAERAIFTLQAKESELKTKFHDIDAARLILTRDREDFKRELAEAGALLGRVALSYREQVLKDRQENSIGKEEVLREAREVQHERRRTLEKMKIRLEELGGGQSDEVMKEYKEVKERDAFLEREIGDLEGSIASLSQLIVELEEKLDVKFKEGIGKINTEFHRFFLLMFGGGEASLSLIKEKKKGKLKALLGLEEEGTNMSEQGEEEESEEGIDINVSLPAKRIKGLQMLSGGERALTSIALIFAMSQVNPPPFLILDETDAALDEANSRRYGDMIENLAKKSQLILITHNRETMSRAGVLYGITMGGKDGVSKTLSIKLEEAVAVAK